MPGNTPSVPSADILALFVKCGSYDALAKHLNITVQAAESRVQRAKKAVAKLPITESARQDRLNRVAELLQAARIDPDSVHKIKSVRLSSWGMAAKDEDGNIQTTALHSTSVDIVPEGAEPELYTLRPAETGPIQFLPPAPIYTDGMERGVIISDAQVGFLRDQDTGELEPIHDPQAMDVCLQVIEAVRPDWVICIGDFIDWPTFSRYEQHKEFVETTQPAIDWGHRWLGKVRSIIGPNAKFIMIGSNHQLRIERMINEKVPGMAGIKRANENPAEWAVCSEPYLLRYNELGITYSGQFPGGEYWITDNLLAIHAPPKKKEFDGSVIHGHTHHITRTTDVSHKRSGRFNQYVYDVGCLCRVGSTTNLRRRLRTIVPSDRGRTDWAQGISVVTIPKATPTIHQLDQIHITEGVAIYEGRLFTGRSD
jgi:metallophosphoesterase superfamily enzyme